MTHIVIKSIAILADNTGNYRYQVQACGENITSIEQAETLVEVKRYKQLGFPYKLEAVDWFTWEKAKKGQLNAYLTKPSFDAEFINKPWNH